MPDIDVYTEFFVINYERNKYAYIEFLFIGCM